MWSHYADTPRDACFLYAKVCIGKYCLAGLKLRQGAREVWQNVQQLHGAMKHICDNDTS